MNAARLPMWCRLNRWASALRHNQSGLALVEFAMVMPPMLILTTGGLEMSRYVIATKRMGEISVMVSDNASRMGAQSAINNKPISEAEINDVFIGAEMQGEGMKMPTNSRIILSSLQRNAQNGQTIKWQRCYGALARNSSYGRQGDGATGTSFAGMGPTGNKITAADNTAVMVVEIFYRYEPIVKLMPMTFPEIKEVTAFNVRDSRDLSQVYNTENVTVSSCPGS